VIISRKLLISNPDVVPRFWGLSYWRYELCAGVFYPIPINYIVRWWEKVYWWPEYALWWVGLYDTPDGVELSLSDFWRIKTH